MDGVVLYGALYFCLAKQFKGRFTGELSMIAQFPLYNVTLGLKF